jgi:hypothetical protein
MNLIIPWLFKTQNMKLIILFSFYLFLISSCTSSEKKIRIIKKDNNINLKTEKKNITLSPISSDEKSEEIKGVYKCFIPYEEPKEIDVENSDISIIGPSTPNTYYEIKFKSNQEVVCSFQEMNYENSEMIISHEFYAKYEIKNKNDGKKELWLVYNPSYGEGPEKIKIILNEKNNSLVYSGHSSTKHKNITLKKVQ